MNKVKFSDIDAAALKEARRINEQVNGPNVNQKRVIQKAADIVAEGSHDYAQLKRVAKEYIADQLRRFAGMSESTRQKTLLSGTNASGGFLVPDEFDRAMRKAPTPQYPLRNLVSSTPMSGNTKDVPVQTSGPTVAWVNEEAQISESTPVYANIQLTAYKAAALVKSTSEFVEDQDVSPDAIENLYQDFVDKLAKHEEDFIISGSGTNQPHGLATEFKASGSDFDVVSAANTKDSITYANMRSLLYKLNKVYRNQGVFVLTAAAMTIVSGLNDGTNGSQKVWTSRHDAIGPIPDGADGLIFDRPAFINDQIGATRTIGGVIAASKASGILFMDPRQAYIIGQRTGSRIETGLDGSDFSHDRISHRVTKRFAGRPVTGLERKPVAVLAWRATT